MAVTLFPPSLGMVPEDYFCGIETYAAVAATPAFKEIDGTIRTLVVQYCCFYAITLEEVQRDLKAYSFALQRGEARPESLAFVHLILKYAFCMATSPLSLPGLTAMRATHAHLGPGDFPFRQLVTHLDELAGPNAWIKVWLCMEEFTQLRKYYAETAALAHARIECHYRREHFNKSYPRGGRFSLWKHNKVLAKCVDTPAHFFLSFRLMLLGVDAFAEDASPSDVEYSRMDAKLEAIRKGILVAKDYPESVKKVYRDFHEGMLLDRSLKRGVRLQDAYFSVSSKRFVYRGMAHFFRPFKHLTPTVLCPEIEWISPEIEKGPPLLVDTKIVGVYRDFEKQKFVRELSYSILYGLFRFYSKHQAPEIQSMFHVLSPEKFAKIVPHYPSTVVQIMRQLKEIHAVYTPPPPKIPSSVLDSSFSAAPHKQKQAKRTHAPRRAAPTKEEPPSVLLPQMKQEGAPLPRIQRPQIPESLALIFQQGERINYIPEERVARCLEPSYTEDWEHGFTTTLERFLRTASPYCYVFPEGNTQQYALMLLVRKGEEERFSPAFATWGMVRRGKDTLCFHRCIQRKSHSDFFNAAAKKQIFNLVEFPPLQRNPVAGKPLQIAEEEMTHDSLGLVTLRDRKFNVTITVLPINGVI